MAAKRYSQQKVTRYIFDTYNYKWNELVVYNDATVRDNGEHGYLKSKQAMLRAYSVDPNFYGNQDYQDGNGIYLVDREEAEQNNDLGMMGWVYDCDGDLALKRISMDVVIRAYNFGHAKFEYIGMVSEDKDHEAEYYNDPDQFNGNGDFNSMRLERWMVDLHRPNK